jgi:hypothetical protein
LSAAYAEFLRRFDATDAHDADGYGSTSAWLAAKGQLTKKDAWAAVREMRRLGERPRLGAAVTAGEITKSWALAIADWTRKLSGEMRDETDRILLDAAAAGASLDDLATIAACAIENWRQQQPDPDNPDDGRSMGSTSSRRRNSGGTLCASRCPHALRASRGGWWSAGWAAGTGRP